MKSLCMWETKKSRARGYLNRRMNCGSDITVAILRTSAWNVDVRSDTTSTQSRAQHFNVQDRSVGSGTLEPFLSNFEVGVCFRAQLPPIEGRSATVGGEQGMGGVKGIPVMTHVTIRLVCHCLWLKPHRTNAPSPVKITVLSCRRVGEINEVTSHNRIKYK